MRVRKLKLRKGSELYEWRITDTSDMAEAIAWHDPFHRKACGSAAW